MITETDRDNLREYMPELLSQRFGITDLRRSFRCPSPNHDDRDPSAHYYENDHSVHCFGCGKTWDVFSLIGELDGIDGFAEQAQAAETTAQAQAKASLRQAARGRRRRLRRGVRKRLRAALLRRERHRPALPALARPGRRRRGDLRPGLHQGPEGDHAGVPRVRAQGLRLHHHTVLEQGLLDGKLLHGAHRLQARRRAQQGVAAARAGDAPVVRVAPVHRRRPSLRDRGADRRDGARQDHRRRHHGPGRSVERQAPGAGALRNASRAQAEEDHRGHGRGRRGPQDPRQDLPRPGRAQGSPCRDACLPGRRQGRRRVPHGHARQGVGVLQEAGLGGHRLWL